MRPLILLVDDHPVVRQALRGLLEQGGLEVVGEARDAGEALSRAADLYRDLVVLDVASGHIFVSPGILSADVEVGLTEATGLPV